MIDAMSRNIAGVNCSTTNIFANRAEPVVADRLYNTSDGRNPDRINAGYKPVIAINPVNNNRK